MLERNLERETGIGPATNSLEERKWIVHKRLSRLRRCVLAIKTHVFPITSKITLSTWSDIGVTVN